MDSDSKSFDQSELAGRHIATAEGISGRRRHRYRLRRNRIWNSESVDRAVVDSSADTEAATSDQPESDLRLHDFAECK